MNVRRPAILFLSSFIIGIIVAYDSIPVFVKVLVGIIALILYFKLLLEGKLKIIVLLVIMGFFIIGFFRFKYEENKFDTYTLRLESLGKGNKNLTGKVVSIGKSTNSNYYILENCVIEGLSLGRCRLYFSDELLSDVKIGNTIFAIAGTSTIDAPQNEGEFNQKNYYRSDGISFIAYAKSIDVTNENYNKLKQKIYEIKLVIKNQIRNILNDRDAGLFTGMLTGDRSGIDKEQKKMFSENGIAHIIAISGLHLSILGLAFFTFLRKFLSVNIASFIVSIFIFVYGIFIDASATSLRAISMLYVRFMSYAVGRTYDSKNTLYIIGFIFLLMHPHLLFNAGIQFSYVAIFALNTEVKIEMKKPIKIPAVITLTLFLFPITIFHYFTYPLYSIFLNLIVIPLMSFVLGFGLLSLASSFIYLPIGKIISYVIHLIFLVYDNLCLAIDKLPYNILWLGRPNLYEVLFYYVALFIVIYSINNLYKAPEKKYFANYNVARKTRDYDIVNSKSLVGASYTSPFVDSNGKLLFKYKLFNFVRLTISIVLILLTVLSISIRPHSDLRMTFISIGQGDSILIESKNTVLTVDGGSTSNKSNGEYILAPHMKSRAINHIDYAFITHADADHTNGIIYLIENEDDLKIYNLVLPINAKDDSKFDKFKSLAKDYNVKMIYLKEEDKMSFDNGININVLSPNQGSLNKKDYDQNELSLTFRFDYNKHSCLFTGDIGNLTMNRMINDNFAYDNIASDVLKVPHHGSKNSNVIEFFEKVNPYLAVVSYGKNNNYGHPNADTVKSIEDTGAKVLKTGELGQIDIYFDKEYIYYTYFNQGKTN